MIALDEIDRTELVAATGGVRPVELDADPARRAVVAFLKSPLPQAVYPAPIGLEHDEKLYIALVSDAGIHAVYRVRADLQLKRLRRVPVGVAYAAELQRRGDRG